MAAQDEDVVVGSGPSGIAAAHALLARGRKVRMLDVGEVLEPQHAARAARMGASDPDAWLKEDLKSLRTLRREMGERPMAPYGSDFAVRDVVGLFADGSSREIALRPSFARGGLSNGWGSAVAPCRLEDIADWPAEARRLDAHYKAVARFMPIAVQADDLMDVFSLWQPEQIRPLPPSPQGGQFLKRLSSQAKALADSKIRFGQARQAVAEGCRACRMCLYGCPYGLIFNASSVLDDLIKREGFTYEPCRLVRRIEEDATGARLVVRDLDTGTERLVAARRVFLAAGVLPTAQIMLASIGAPGETLTLLDSQQMLMPMLHMWPQKGDVAAMPQHVLAQVFLEILDPAISPKSVHVQVYTYNDHFQDDIRARFRNLALAEPLVQALSRRLIVAQAFLHSNRSGRIRISREGEGSEARLKLEPQSNPESLPTLNRVKHRLAGALLNCGIGALWFMARPGAIGSSFHCGGSIPMREAPGRLESDVLGRPAGFSRVHIVDASVLPSIPATTITFSVMANAHRIASSAPV